MSEAGAFPSRSAFAYPRVDPVRIEVHYRNGIGYWAKINGEDAGLYVADWATFCQKLGALLAAANLLHVEVTHA